jgi:K+-sensing histidine kinase KdpD
MLFVRPRRLRPRHPVARYAVGVLVVVVATVIQWELMPLLPSPQSLLFYPAVFAAAWFSGLGPGIVAAALSALSIAYFFLPPSFSLVISSPRDQLDLAIFTTLSIVLVLMLAQLEKAIAARDLALAEAHEATGRLAEQEALLGAVIEHAPVGIAFTTTGGEVRLRNGSWRSFAETGCTTENELLASDAPERDPLRWRDGRVISTDEWRTLLGEAHEKLVEFEAQSRPASNSVRWFSGLFAPVRIGKGRPSIGTVSVLRDVTAEHRIDEMREEFLAVITHDLRTPITTIGLGLQSVLQRRQAHDGVVAVPESTLERMRRAATRLGDMVNELLDASRVELATMKLDRREVDLSRFVAELVDDVRPSLRGHAVMMDVPDGPLAASVDPPRLAQVITNLLENASKYSRPDSAIRVAVHEDDGKAELTVTDEGEGIAEADIPRLFDRFFQARRARELRPGQSQSQGLGLGLYITKGIVDAHGGRLTVESARGIGSTFRVSLPLSTPPPGSERKGGPALHASARPSP